MKFCNKATKFREHCFHCVVLDQEGKNKSIWDLNQQWNKDQIVTGPKPFSLEQLRFITTKKFEEVKIYVSAGYDIVCIWLVVKKTASKKSDGKFVSLCC